MRFIFILLIYFRAETAINEGGNNNKIEEEGYEIERVRKLEDQTRNSKSGACGSELIYSISTDKLMITGSGDMFDYELIEEISSKEYSTTPWDFIKRNISIITISSTTTHIGSYAFYYFQELSTINLPTSLTSIGSIFILWLFKTNKHYNSNPSYHNWILIFFTLYKPEKCYITKITNG